MTMSYLDPVQASKLLTWYLIRFITILLKAHTVICLFVYMNLQYVCICLLSRTCVLRGKCAC